MIQEIYDYLWIRNYIASHTTAVIIDALNIEKANNDNTSYVDIVNALAYLLEQENFLLSKDFYLDRVSTIINEFRFDYNKDKELNGKINYIIERINCYKQMTEKRKRYLIKDFYYKEVKDRRLPLCYRREYTVDGCIMMDGYNYANTFFKTQNEFEADDFFSFISTVNLIISRYPEFFDSIEKTMIVYNTVNECIDAVSELPRIDRSRIISKQALSYAKKTLIRLKNLSKDKQKEKIK